MFRKHRVIWPWGSRGLVQGGFWRKGKVKREKACMNTLFLFIALSTGRRGGFDLGMKVVDGCSSCSCLGAPGGMLFFWGGGEEEFAQMGGE